MPVAAVRAGDDHAADADDVERLAADLDSATTSPTAAIRRPSPSRSSVWCVFSRHSIGSSPTPNGSSSPSTSSSHSPSLKRADVLDHRLVGRQRDLLRRRGPSSWSQSSNASPSRPTCSLRAAERDQQHVLVAAVGDVAAHLGRDAGELALAELPDLALDHERERAGEDEVDLLLGRVAVDAPALAGPQDDLVDAEGRDAQLAAERDEALLGVGVERGVADAGCSCLHACRPTVSDSSGVRPPWWPLKRSWRDG